MLPEVLLVAPVKRRISPALLASELASDAVRPSRLGTVHSSVAFYAPA